MEIDISKETSSNQQKTLVQACKNKDIATAKKLLEHGANVNEVESFIDYSYHEFTPLIVACKNNDLEIVKLLVHYGADVNKMVSYDMDNIHNDGDYYEDLPILICFHNKHFDLLKFLVEHGAITERLSILGYNFNLSRTALEDGYKEIYEFLIERRESLNYKNGNYAHHFEILSKDIYPIIPENAKSFTSHSNLFGNLTIDLLYSLIEKHKYIKEIKDERDEEEMDCYSFRYIRFNGKDCYVKYDYEKTYQYYTDYMIEKCKEKISLIKEGIIAKFWNPENVKAWTDYYHVDYDEALDLME